MKKILLYIVTLLFISHASFANHFTGAELRYKYTGTPLKYIVTVSLYKTCESGAIDFPSFISINAESKSQNKILTRNMSRVSNDTLQPFCIGTVTTCTNLSSTYQGYLVAAYSDTIELPVSATDWLLNFSNSGRNFGITNLQGASGQSYYIDAPLNTSNINSSPVIPDFPPHVLFLNDSISIPLTATDADGDSIAYSFVAPLSGSGISIAYAPGFNLAMPFGTGGLSYIDGNNNMVLKSAMAGKFTVCLSIKEYRNGVYLGYITRDFIVISKGAQPADALSVPEPTKRILLNTFTCPGKNNSLTLDFKDADPSDSVYVDIQQPALTGWTFNISNSPGVGTARGVISWTTPISADPLTMPFFEFSVKVRDNSCALTGKATYVYKVKLRDCSADSVWPGDANSDKIVDLYDPLAIALAYGDTGTKRANATTNWMAEHCDYWDGTFLNNIDKKHADCNGDGIVDTADLNAITANYGQTHAKGRPNHKTTAAADFYFDHSGISANPDSTVSIKILLGRGAAVGNIYGLATNILVDGLTLATPPVITRYQFSWMGGAHNSINFVKDVAPNSIDWAYARTDKANINGLGLIAYLNFKIPAATANGTLVTLSWNKTRIIDNEGTDFTDFNAMQDTFYVWHLPNSVHDVNHSISNVSLYPNPADANVIVNWYAPTTQDVAVTITDIAGRQLVKKYATTHTGYNHLSIPTAELATGMYLLNIVIDNEPGVQTLKFVKQ